MSNQNTDLGRDSIGKLMFKLSAPAIIAQIVNVLYNIKEELQNYEIKKGLCGYEVANCVNTKENIKRALDSEKSRLHYYNQLDITHKLFRRG